MEPASPISQRRERAPALLGGIAAVTLAVLGAGVVPARAQDLHGELDAKQQDLEQAQHQEGVLSTEIERYSQRIEQLQGEVAMLRNREAIVEQELAETQRELDVERRHLEVLRERLRHSLHVLGKRLVEIYKSDAPDVLTVILEADGFGDMLERYEYMQRIEERDSRIVAQVRELRDETEDTVQRIRAARDEIAAKEQELERTRVQLESEEAALAGARSRKQRALSSIETHIEHLEGDISGLEEEIQEQLAASSAPELPAGPIETGSSGMIWPVSGSVTSPFGWRWGRMHEGIDISAPAGTPVRAAKSGAVAIAAPTGGYGNYICINHGGGLSTCYAHLSSYAVGVGDSVGQGEVIGSVGCTGSCFGDHLHFEVRVNGAAVDPLGYL